MKVAKPGDGTPAEDWKNRAETIRFANTGEVRMRSWRYLLIVVLAAASFLPAGAEAPGVRSLEASQGEGHILMLRHALAPGFGDPDGFKIGDCATQRNLNDRGRMQAAAIGDWLRKKGVASARVFSSQWCRCLETAELLELGPVTELPALNSFYELTENREPNLKALREFIAAQPATGGLIIMVTHQVTISAMTDLYVSSGEGVVLKLKRNAAYDVIGRIDFVD
jgi:phosphohistidine phosphatase SixA